MKKFILLHYGFEKPTPEIMAAWGKWFEATQASISSIWAAISAVAAKSRKGGTKDLSLGPDSITGFTIVNAESLDDAEKMAQSNPYISSIRVYEVRRVETRSHLPLQIILLAEVIPDLHQHGDVFGIAKLHRRCERSGTSREEIASEQSDRICTSIATHSG